MSLTSGFLCCVTLSANASVADVPARASTTERMMKMTTDEVIVAVVMTEDAARINAVAMRRGKSIIGCCFSVFQASV